MKTKHLLFTTIAIFGLTIVTFGQIVPSYVPTNGLVGWWPFDGNANDESGNANNGTVLGPVLDNDRFSNPNSAYSFKSNNINCGSNAILDLDNLTISAWINADTIIPDWQTIVCKFEANPWGSYGIYLFDKKISAYFQTDTTFSSFEEVRSNISISTNNWYHVVASHDTLTGIKLYINGVLDSALNKQFHILNCPTDSLRIGSQGLSYSFPLLGGKIDDIGIWNRALTPTEVTDLYNSLNIGINDISLNNLVSVFPCPAQNVIKVKVNPQIVGSPYIVYNNLGGVVLAGRLNSENTIIELGNLSGGIYMLSVGKNSIQTFKVIKE